jgi:DNA invertase Pin-like site-specific DNA recombinase
VKYAYARVSTGGGRGVNAQVRQLTRAGCKKVFRKAIKRRNAGKPMREVARSYNVHGSTISRLSA